jgi:transcriptional regulator with XRE-family HTH domain
MQLARTKEWRESRGLTQRELAAEADVGEVTVARIEAGASVTPPTARKIAGALGISVADLLERPPVPLADAPVEQGQPSEEELIAALNQMADVLRESGVEAVDVQDLANKFFEEMVDTLRKTPTPEADRLADRLGEGQATSQ